MENTVSIVDDVTAFIARRDTGNMFTQPLLRNGLHNPVILLLLGADRIESTAPSIVA
jgi:hypothetical protein